MDVDNSESKIYVNDFKIFIFVRCRVCVIIREKFVFKIKFFFLLDWVNFDDVAIEFVFVVMDILFWN